ncbi:AraC family transcriptional regulator [Paraconexibacter sp. AEG42_29]|uniref:AraC family transcriptional regulator n=1 Tax=Paraconexibacter sp. AEG42_29 TaxID=2997339 RepID=UPI00339D453D
MADRLRDLLDLIVASLDDPAADGRGLAGRAHFSRDHFDRLLAAATGETPVALRRRLLLERAAWQLHPAATTSAAAEAESGRGGPAVAAVAATAGYGSLAAFSRAFSRAFGVPPSEYARAAAAGAAVPSPRIDAPNGIHFLAPAGFVLPSAPTAGARAARAAPRPPAT